MMITRLALVLVVLFLSSCIDFTGQTVTFRYDAQADRLYIFQLFEGIHGDDDGTELSSREIEQLESVIKGQRTFFFDNNFIEFDRADIEASVKNLEAKKQKTEAVKLELAVKKLVVANVNIQSGEFFLNQRNQLSGYQYITVDHFSALLEAINRVINHEVVNAKVFGKYKVSQAHLEKVVAGEFVWIKMKGNRLIVTLPISYADYLNEKMEMAARLREPLEKEFATAKSIQKSIQWSFYPYIALIENDIQISYDNNAVTVAVGHPESRETPFYMRRAGTYNPNAVGYAQRHYRKTEFKRVTALIEQLGHSEFKQREAAMTELRSKGVWALAQLEAAKNHKNANVRARVRTILQAAKSASRVNSAQATLPAAVMERMRAFFRTGEIPD